MQRYDCVCVGYAEGYGKMAPRDDGDYVLYDDHLAAEKDAEIAGLQERVKELEGALGRIHTCAKDIIAEDDEDINLKAEWVIEVIEQTLKGE